MCGRLQNEHLPVGQNSSVGTEQSTSIAEVMGLRLNFFRHNCDGLL